MDASDYTDVVSQALQLKHTGRELSKAKRLVDTLQVRIAAKERAAEEASAQYAVDIARVERQRNELRDLLKDKTSELAMTSDRLESLQRELAVAHDTIARLRDEGIKKIASPFHVQERPENPYDALLAHMVKSSGDRQRLVDRYRDIETNSSNLLWQTVVEQTMLRLQESLFRLNDFVTPQMPIESMVRKMADVETLQPSFLLYILRQLEYEESKPKRMTKKQISVFEDDLSKALDAMVHAWIIARVTDNLTQNQK